MNPILLTQVVLTASLSGSMVTLKAAPNNASFVYYVEQPAGVFSTAHVDATEELLGGIHTGEYELPEPAAYVSIIWADGAGGYPIFPNPATGAKAGAIAASANTNKLNASALMTVTITLPAGGNPVVSWTPIPGATRYGVNRSTGGGFVNIGTVNAPATIFADLAGYIPGATYSITPFS